MTSSFLYASIRSPFGKYAGTLSHVRPDDLAAHAMTALLDKVPALDPAAIEDIYWGNSNGAGEDSRNVGRMAALLARIPVQVPANTINRLCGSSLDAAMIASRTVETGDADVILVGGVESMSRAPWILPKPARPFTTENLSAQSSTLGWRFINERMPKEWLISLGDCNELIAAKYSISRRRQDEFALRSHHLAAKAWEDGRYAHVVTSMPGSELSRDESIRPDASLETMAELRPVFKPGGTITAGNASPLSDGAAAVLIGSEHASTTIGREPLARIAGRGVNADDPNNFGFAPVEAANRALARAGVSWSDVEAIELNEAFASQCLACIDAWQVDPQIVNTWGGAIAIGHPLGASGARLISTLCARLRSSGGRWGVAAICIGLGQGLAIVVENLDTTRR